MGMKEVDDKPRRRRIWRWLLIVPLLLMLVSVLQVAMLRFVDPPMSAFMFNRQLGAWVEGDWRFRLAHEALPLEDISPYLPLALIASEDQSFIDHNGFDFKAIEKARKHNARGRKVRGGSTISQQVAKNMFLWSGRSWLRKGIEAWYTVLIETLWPKYRILEMYANYAEFGDGIYGAQAAAREYFGKDASALSAAESARLAAVLPNPKRYSVDKPGPYVQRRTNAIQRQMRAIGGTAYLEDL
ncbi:monofunctional biosynthetic peptidoglycan transglycosylase [Luteimonas cucumeris]|uniref:Biosynthetic peptidoglycan transglycosylase n=1 Tax=Luteimonas cucumeris TaxID=985012 RepID=A0A562LFE3_9GAMM|nr:monofunctional biosynthetic peptidoglycan transglycosylase [Luteimonas cucumeris]TWI06331.1 monofunctional biosynthetic peptidoglycan transglycosylase [Luteimonas cucumeris]